MAKETERLATSIDHLNEQIATLRNSIDEFRTAMQWGLQNGKFQPPSPEVDDLAAVVESTIRNEMSAVQNSLDDFSLDMQWAVRQIRTAAESVKTQRSLFEE